MDIRGVILEAGLVRGRVKSQKLVKIRHSFVLLSVCTTLIAIKIELGLYDVDGFAKNQRANSMPPSVIMVYNKTAGMRMCVRLLL